MNRTLEKSEARNIISQSVIVRILSTDTDLIFLFPEQSSGVGGGFHSRNGKLLSKSLK